MGKGHSRFKPYFCNNARKLEGFTKIFDTSLKADKAMHFKQRHSPIARIFIMRTTAILAQTKRTKKGRSANRAEEWSRWSGIIWLHGSLRPTSAVCTIVDYVRGGKQLA